MSLNGLSLKQKEFCKNVVSGMSYKDSYIAAYNSNGGDQTVYNESSKLMQKKEIQEEIKRLSEPLEQAYQLDRITEAQKIKALLWERIEICRQKEDETAIARYTDQLNKLNGSYKDVENTDKDNTDFNNIDTTTLLKLVK